MSRSLANCIILIAFGVLSPISLLILVSNRLLTLSVSKNNYLSFVALVSAILGYINTLKVPDGDLVIYLFRYDTASSVGIIDYLNYDWGNGRQELIFSFLSYLIYIVTGGNHAIYVWILTFLIYFFAALAIRRNCIEPGRSFLAFLLLVVFPIFFSISAHLIRQQLALSVALYLFSLRSGNIKYYVRMILYVLPVFVHYSVLLIVFIDVLSNLRVRLKDIFFIVISLSILLQFVDIDLINSLWIIQDLSVNDVSEQYVRTLCVISGVLGIVNWIQSDIPKSRDWLMLVLAVAIVMLFSPSNILTYRLAYFMYFIIFVTLPLGKLRIEWINLATRSVVILAYPIFAYTLTNSAWSYDLIRLLFLWI